MTIYTGIISKNLDEAKKDLFEFASFDMDLSGENGIEYTSDKAIENGFESELDYILSLHNNVEDLIRAVLDSLCKSFDSVADYIDYKYIDNENNFVVFFVETSM